MGHGIAINKFLLKEFWQLVKHVCLLGTVALACLPTLAIFTRYRLSLPSRWSDLIKDHSFVLLVE